MILFSIRLQLSVFVLRVRLENSKLSPYCQQLCSVGCLGPLPLSPSLLLLYNISRSYSLPYIVFYITFTFHRFY